MPSPVRRRTVAGVAVLCLLPVLAAAGGSGFSRNLSSRLKPLPQGVAQARGAETIPALVAIATRNSTALVAARAAVETSRARLAAAGLRPNPRLELSAGSDLLFANEGEYQVSAAVSQDFPLAGRLARLKDVARVDVALAQAEVAEAERKLAASVATDALRLQLADLRVATLDGIIGTEVALLDTVRKRLAAAEVSEMDVNVVRIDIERHRQERAALLVERRAIEAGLDVQLGRSDAAPLAIAGQPELRDPGPLATLQARARGGRPDIAKAILQIDRATAGIALARAERWQDLSVSLGVTQDKQVINGAPPQDPGRLLGVSVSLPLPIRDTGRERLGVARAEADGAQAQVAALEQAVDVEVASDRARVVALQSAVEAARSNSFPPAERNLTLARVGYSMGLVSIFDVVQAQRQLAEAKARYFDLLGQAMVAQVDLQLASGAPLGAVSAFQQER